MAKNKNLLNAKDAKNDEFYTRLFDIEKEVYNYGVIMGHFKNKVILLPCDESEHTNFYKHFMMMREDYGWKKLISVGYRENRPAEVHIVEVTEDGMREENKLLVGNGDFRNAETQKFFDECDVVVTNPPFSLFREFIALLMEKNKKFLIIGNQNARGCKEIFSLIKDDKLWFGYTTPKEFLDRENNMNPKKFGNICWFTNLHIKKREVILNTGIDYEYGEKNGWYQKFENYDAIDIKQINQIPMDYDDVMGVPITFLDKYNPNQFEILGKCENLDLYGLKTKVYTHQECKDAYFAKFGKKGIYDLNAAGVVIENGIRIKRYHRILIKRKH